MSDTSPLPFLWDGECFKPPSDYFSKKCDERFVIGQKHLIVEYMERSTASHAQQFAWLHEAWQQLPEKLADLYPTPEHLRKRALIEAGFYHEEAIDCGTNAAALRVSAYARKQDGFALVVVRGPIVLVRTAKSQNYRSMDRKEFQASKSAILEIVAQMIETAPETLQKQAGKAA